MDAFYRYACGSAADFFITDPCFRWEWAKMEASFNAVKANMVATKSAREGCSWGMDSYGSKQDGLQFQKLIMKSVSSWVSHSDPRPFGVLTGAVPDGVARTQPLQ
jgi:hypothetical protein